MAPILANAEVQERLMPYLPSGESLPQTAEEIQNTLTSPQFQQVGASLHGKVSFLASWEGHGAGLLPSSPGLLPCSVRFLALFRV